jgi:hypothetical protein
MSARRTSICLSKENNRQYYYVLLQQSFPIAYRSFLLFAGIEMKGCWKSDCHDCNACVFILPGLLCKQYTHCVSWHKDIAWNISWVVCFLLAGHRGGWHLSWPESPGWSGQKDSSEGYKIATYNNLITTTEIPPPSPYDYLRWLWVFKIQDEIDSLHILYIIPFLQIATPHQPQLNISLAKDTKVTKPLKILSARILPRSKSISYYFLQFDTLSFVLWATSSTFPSSLSTQP